MVRGGGALDPICAGPSVQAVENRYLTMNIFSQRRRPKRDRSGPEKVRGAQTPYLVDEALLKRRMMFVSDDAGVRSNRT
jgi:hypothetical protein